MGAGPGRLGALLAAEWFLTSPIGCPLAPGSSVFGTAQWSWLPPGRARAWEVPSGTHPDGPPFARLGMPLLLAPRGTSLLLPREDQQAT